MNNEKIFKMTLSSLFLAIAYVLPFLTGQIPKVSSMLCPLHIPVILCGFICGWGWGGAVGFVSVLLRSATLGMPTFFPTAVCMAFELAAYGIVSGAMYKILPRKKISIYISLFTAMIVGRIVWGVAMFICMGVKGSAFTFSAFVVAAFSNAIPGIIIQILLIPMLVMFFEKRKKQ